MAEFWKQFLEQTVSSGKNGSIEDIGVGLRCAWGDCALPITNAYYLTAPVADASVLGVHLSAVKADASRRSGLPWLFYAPTEAVTALGFDVVDAVGAEHGLGPFMSIREMSVEVSKLRAPKRPLPEVEYERVTSLEGARVALEINLGAYGMPLEMVPSCVESEMFLAGKQRECGILARVNGEAVSTASVIDVNGVLYVALVATHPDHRQRGYADAAMRKAIEVAAAEFGLSTVALDATEMGEPIYAAMGFVPTGTEWRVLMEANH